MQVEGNELEALQRVLTRGWPIGFTVGPCNEWHETMCTSSGRNFSKAAFSGAFTEV